MALQASGWHLVQHTRLTVVDRGRVVAPTRGRVCGAVQAMASPMGCVGPPPGRQASARQGHLRVPLSAAPRRRPRSVVMVGSRSSRRRWMRSRAMAHTAVVCSSKKLRLPPSQQSPCVIRHQRMERQAPMMPLSFSSNCGGPMPARDASPQTVCRWVPCGRDHTTKTNYVVCVGVSFSRPAVHGGLATHRVRVPPSQPELPGGHRLRPGWGHKSRQKMC